MTPFAPLDHGVPRRVSHFPSTRGALLIVFVAMWGVSACTGGGSTGHEGLDVRTPPTQIPDVESDLGAPRDDGAPGWDADPPPPVDAATALDVDGGGARDAAPIDVSVDGTDPSLDASPDTQRVRDGAVVRDGVIVNPSDAGDAGSDVTLDVGPPTVCGDGKKEGREECDDGNQLNGDGCSALCTNTSACDTCFTSWCADWCDPPVPWPLCSTVQGNATSGEAAGRPRKDLCQETYTCLLRTQCVDPILQDPTPCYCGTVSRAACLAGQMTDGPCRTEIENGMETTDVSFLLTNMSSPKYAAGAAIVVVRNSYDGTGCRSACTSPAGDGGTTSDSGASDTPSQ